MAHEIEKYGEVRQGNVKINGESVLRGRAWHGLGQELEEGLSAEQAFRTLGIDWGTELAPLYATVEVGTADGKTEMRRVPIEGHFAQVRRDNQDVLGLVSEGYKPFENMELAKLADSLVGADAAVTVETAGTLMRGRRVFVLVKLPGSIEAARDDVLNQYICLSNGHGGFAHLCGYPTSIRVVCANTLRWSERDLAKGFRFRHSGDFESKLAQARTVLGLAIAETKKFEQMVKALVKTKMSEAETRTYMEMVYDSCFGTIDMEGPAETVEKLVTRRKETCDTWMKNLSDERQQLVGIRGSAWAAYNAISQWHDHERGRYDTVHQSDARVHSNLFGVSQEHKAKAFRSALALAR